jgi:signal transduction histidine kinase
MRRIVVASAQMLLTLINNILDIGKIDAGKPIHLQCINFYHMAAMIITFDATTADTGGDLLFVGKPISLRKCIGDAMQFMEPFALMHNTRLSR